MTIIVQLRNRFTSPSRPDSERAVRELFEQYEKPFFFFILKHFDAIDREDIKDIYSESFYALYENIVTGKLDRLEKATLKTYLFKIGYFKAIKFHDKYNIYDTYLDRIPELIRETSYSEEMKEEIRIVRREVSLMKDPCKRVMTYFHEQKRMKDIAELMNYAGEDVAKKTKSKCQKGLVERLKEIFRKDGLIEQN